MNTSIASILDKAAQGRDLTEEEAFSAFTLLFDGDLSPVQAGALLMALRTKGETAVELAQAVRVALDRANLVSGLDGPRIDTCGTGGDLSCSFNCSTLVAVYLAAMGHTVVKHGNRSISSSCGSADIVEALGLPMPTDPEAAAAEIADKGFVFLFAPAYHPAFKHIMPVRRDLGVRTLFNILGPLLNPARPTHQLIGAARPELMALLAETLALSGVERAAVVHGFGGDYGFDELTPFGPSKVVWVENGGVVETELDPAEFDLPSGSVAEVCVQGKDHAVQVFKGLLAGEGHPTMKAMLALNLGLALHLIEDGLPMSQAVRKARAAVDAGAAKGFLA